MLLLLGKMFPEVITDFQDGNLVISFMAMAGFILLAPAIFDIRTQVPIISTEGFKLLFLDFTKDIVNYVELEGVVTPDWLGHAILSVVGMYFGSSITSRR